MDFDEIQSDREQSPALREQELFDDVEDNVDDWNNRERSPTPVYDTDKVKPRKRLVKKSAVGDESEAPAHLIDEDEEDFGREFAREGSESLEKKRRKKRREAGDGSGKKEKRHKFDKYAGSGGKGGGSKLGLSRKPMMSGRSKDHEVKEMWDTIAGGDSEVLLLLLSL